MSKKMLVFSLLLFLCFSSSNRLWAQTDNQSTGSHQFDMTGFPQWARDLRRAEIVAFGSFPFMYLFTNVGIGLAGLDQNERGRTLGIAAGGAVLVAIVDFGIERYKRSARNREISRLPDGTPVIIRSPMYSDDADSFLPEFDSAEVANP